MSSKRFFLAEGARILGSDGTVQWLVGTTDIVSSRLLSGWSYSPEKANRQDGEAIKGESKSEDHYANFVECVRSRKEPNASVELGYRSAVAAHMANLSYRRRQRVTLETARQVAKQ